MKTKKNLRLILATAIMAPTLVSASCSKNSSPTIVVEEIDDSKIKEAVEYLNPIIGSENAPLVYDLSFWTGFEKVEEDESEDLNRLLAMYLDTTRIFLPAEINVISFDIIDLGTDNYRIVFEIEDSRYTDSKNPLKRQLTGWVKLSEQTAEPSEDELKLQAVINYINANWYNSSDRFFEVYRDNYQTYTTKVDDDDVSAFDYLINDDLKQSLEAFFPQITFQNSVFESAINVEVIKKTSYYNSENAYQSFTLRFSTGQPKSYVTTQLLFRLIERPNINPTEPDLYEALREYVKFLSPYFGNEDSYVTIPYVKWEQFIRDWEVGFDIYSSLTSLLDNGNDFFATEPFTWKYIRRFVDLSYEFKTESGFKQFKLRITDEDHNIYLDVQVNLTVLRNPFLIAEERMNQATETLSNTVANEQFAKTVSHPKWKSFASAKGATSEEIVNALNELLTEEDSAKVAFLPEFTSVKYVAFDTAYTPEYYGAVQISLEYVVMVEGVGDPQKNKLTKTVNIYLNVIEPNSVTIYNNFIKEQAKTISHFVDKTVSGKFTISYENYKRLRANFAALQTAIERQEMFNEVFKTELDLNLAMYDIKLTVPVKLEFSGIKNFSTNFQFDFLGQKSDIPQEQSTTDVYKISSSLSVEVLSPFSEVSYANAIYLNRASADRFFRGTGTTGGVISTTTIFERLNYAISKSKPTGPFQLLDQKFADKFAYVGYDPRNTSYYMSNSTVPFDFDLKIDEFAHNFNIGVSMYEVDANGKMPDLPLNGSLSISSRNYEAFYADIQNLINNPGLHNTFINFINKWSYNKWALWNPNALVLKIDANTSNIRPPQTITDGTKITLVADFQGVSKSFVFSYYKV